MSNNVVIDLSNYRDTSGSRVDPGRYRVQVEDIEMKTSKKGSQMFVVYLAIVGGPHDGKTILDRLTLTDAAMFRVVWFLQALNVPTPKKRIQINPRALVGRVLEVDVKDGEPYNGRVKSEVDGYHSVQVAQGQAADLEDDFPEETSPLVEDLPEVEEVAQETSIETPSVPDAGPMESTFPQTPDVIDLSDVEL